MKTWKILKSKKLSLIIIFLFTAFTDVSNLLAQPSLPPDPGGENLPVGGEAPIDGLIPFMMVVAIVLAYYVIQKRMSAQVK
ncbi:MAG: hypothetical protein KAG96_02785 [Ichthyobacteriaceae bacterium]|nr:hypothetical protein [Ichthyobacteriaceae bacterium]